MPKKDHENRAFVERQLNVQTEAVKDFKGQTVFTSGNYNWYSGLKGLKPQEEYTEDIFDKNTILAISSKEIETDLSHFWGISTFFWDECILFIETCWVNFVHGNNIEKV